MLSTTSTSELINACQILFSPEGSKCSVDFLKTLNPSTLKKVYRKKALETHPDRRGNSTSEASGELFIKVKTAYEILKPVADGKTRIPEYKKRNTDKPKKNYTEKTEKPFDAYYSGTLPFHPLLFGQYLYYSGTITWKTLMDAIIWQRSRKKTYGQIALQWKMLSENDISNIMRRKKPGEKFGAYAKKSGYLTIFQHLAIMGKQRKQAGLFGDYFIQKGILTKRQVDNLVQKTINHNNHLANYSGM